MDCAIIGSGIAGIAMAVRLANKGHDVTVYEKNPQPGGKIAEIRKAGYRFDTGPSVFTLPELVEELFREAGENIPEYFTYKPLEVSCKYFFSEGLQTDSGEEVSTREIKKILQECIENEDKRKPLTDDRLSAILNDKGYQIARRTVAKYREQLGLPVARLRKEL